MIYKIQECEGQLTMASDKGEQIGAEGSVADSNTITEQISSLKSQLSSLRRAVEQRQVWTSLLTQLAESDTTQ